MRVPILHEGGNLSLAGDEQVQTSGMVLRLMGQVIEDGVRLEGAMRGDAEREGSLRVLASLRPIRNSDNESGTVVLTRTRTKKPSLYRVLLLNDDYTPMEFVVHVLQRFFNKTLEEATEIMLHVHQNGVGLCGVFTYEVAETKVTMVMDFSRKHQHPLQCVMEKS
jgi:ATP-dependent Clp protease adaptor protein ClpS